MSTPDNRGPAAPGKIDAAAVLAQMQAALAEIGEQRNGAQARAVELAIALAASRARVAALEAEIETTRRIIGGLETERREWRAMADASKGMPVRGPSLVAAPDAPWASEGASTSPGAGRA